VNGLGTILGVTIATIGISGLQQLFPGQFYLEPLFNGLTLVAAITIASLATRRRTTRADAAPRTDGSTTSGTGSPGTVPETSDVTPSESTTRTTTARKDIS
jgi:ribose transport system permease protein